MSDAMFRLNLAIVDEALPHLDEQSRAVIARALCELDKWKSLKGREP